MIIESPIALLPINDIDTDQIVPARFLKTLTKVGLRDQLFADWRYDAAGRPRDDFVLNRPDAGSAQILVTGDNFGCGSSREHAAWALSQFGFRAVVSSSFADIFARNALKNGLLTVTVPSATRDALLRSSGAVVRIDLACQALTAPDGEEVTFPIDSFAKHCLLTGVDELEFILNFERAIASYESRQG